MTAAPAPPFGPSLDDAPQQPRSRRLRAPSRRTTIAIVASLVGLTGLTAAQVLVVAPTVASDLGQRSQEALADAGIDSLTVRVDGRDVVLSGEAEDDRQAFAAEFVVAEVDGVRYVDATAVVVGGTTPGKPAPRPTTSAPSKSPSAVGPEASPTARGTDSTRTTLVVVADDGRAIVAGALPDTDTERSIVAALRRTYEDVDVDRLAPPTSTVTGTGGEAVAATVATLGKDAVGVAVSLDRGKITVAARVADPATKAKALAAAAGAVPTTADVVDKITVGALSGPDAATLDAQLSSLPTLVYGAGQTVPGPIGRSVLAAAAFVLVAYPETTVTLVGHTDDSGDEATDTEVSQARARAGEQYLGTLGVRSSRIRTTGLGSAEPARPGTTQQARAANRRLVVVGGS